MSDAQLIVTHFCIPEHVTRVAALGEGFINDTYLVDTSEAQKYILQRKNSSIFPDIPGMMDNIDKVTAHIRSKGGVTLQLIHSRDNKLFYRGPEGACWTCCTYIPDTYTYDYAVSMDLVRAGGLGVGMFHSLTADFQGNLTDTLPGFHDIGYRFGQFAESIERNRSSRGESVASLVEEVYIRKERMESFMDLVTRQVLPQRVSHNDTKLSNFLFDKDRNVVCAIDLDTLKQTTVLFDFGDAVRSYTNPFAEDHPEFHEIRLDMERFYHFSAGYLSRAAWFLNDTEKLHMAFSALYITYEQFLRFLMDYIDGDTYYRIRYPTHNLVRAQSQLALLKSMEDQYDLMQENLYSILNTF